MKILKLFVLIALAMLWTSVGFAEEPPGAPQPTAEHEALGMWVGEWAGSGEMKEGPFGPGGPMRWTETCSWFGGARFNVVCESTGTTPAGPMKGMGISGYNPTKKVYTHYGVDTSGWMGLAEGTRSGDKWTFSSSETMEGKTVHSRFMIVMKSPTEMGFTFEMSEDGKNWMPMMEGTSKKK